jgi:hypothetical protein
MPPSKVNNPVTEDAEEIPGLRAALQEEREKQAALTSVFTRAEAANYAWATARAYRTNLLQRSAAGEEVDPQEIRQAEAEIADALEVARTFPDAVGLAERAAEKATGRVVGALRGEMQRRQQTAQAAYDQAGRDVTAATRARARAWDDLDGATREGNLEVHILRKMLASEIERAS